MWRPKGLLAWNRKTHETVEKLGILPPQTEFPFVVPSSFEWNLLRRQIFETGADAMLKELKKEGIKFVGRPRLRFQLKRWWENRNGYLVFIPEEENAKGKAKEG